MYIYLCVASKYVANNSFVALWGLGPFGPIGPGPFGPIEAELIWAHWARTCLGPGPFGGIGWLGMCSICIKHNANGYFGMERRGGE